MIGSVTHNSQSYGFFSVSRKNENAENSFDGMLTETAEEKLLKNAPDKWVTEPGISLNAVNAAVDFRNNELGIASTEPTHELTPEQREWLNSRHDFSTMQTHIRYSFDYGGVTQYRSKATAEYSNFLADLAYLGVYSADEFIQLSPLDTRPGSNSTLTDYVNDVWNSDCNLTNTAQMVVKHLENMFNFYNERSKDPLKAVEGDTEFAALINEHFLPINQHFFKFISELIDSSDEQPPHSNIIPTIEDCSEKLKEDFGSRM